ncbi:MAG: hypothetical protein GX811_06370, partial [Lentisphaerae bacterium]|nr:hypothetical protein [Lentisphaerota bacterium]
MKQTDTHEDFLHRTHLFNLNGCIGRGAYDVAQFPKATDFIAHLDYLNIDRSLVWQVAARDLSPIVGNRLLLNELDEFELTERLYPVFVITPACFYERGVLEYLHEQLSSGRVRALIISPRFARFSVLQIERLLCELAQYEPLLIWGDSHGTAEFQGFYQLAQKLTQISFILSDRMWGEYT